MWSSPIRLDDVIEIVGYIRKLTGSDDISDGYMMDILQTAKSLDVMPHRFPISGDPPLAELAVRMAPYKDFLIAYGIDEDASTVFAYRVLYSKSDIKKRYFDKI
jgi:hypothetical protein